MATGSALTEMICSQPAEGLHPSQEEPGGSRWPAFQLGISCATTAPQGRFDGLEPRTSAGSSALLLRRG